MERDLETVLATWEADSARLARYGHDGEGAIIAALCADVRRCAEDWLIWLSERDAIVRSGLAERTLRRRFTQWKALDCARMAKGERRYRKAVIPQRPVLPLPPSRSRLDIMRERAKAHQAQLDASRLRFRKPNS